jgi:ubiquinone biosynthesis protein
LTIIGNTLRLARVLGTFRRNGALEPVLDALAPPARVRRAAEIFSWLLSPLGVVGDLKLPPISRAIHALGPSYVKFGQVLSTRPDVVGEVLAEDLKELQDNLPPFSNDEARAMIADQLGAPIDRLFKSLDPPIAAASIAQVHPAVMNAGERVAVKVLRPGVENAFARDIAVFFFVARTIEALDSRSRRLKPTMVVRHFEGVVRREMDLRMEAAAGSEYGDLIRDETGVATPEIIWERTAKRVLTTSWVDGTRMRDRNELIAQGHDLPIIAKRLVRLFLRTALGGGYFHADMHQGNLKVTKDGVVYAFDFGIMGRIDTDTRRAYAEILYGFLNRDYDRGARAHFERGYVKPDQDRAAFAQALRSIGEPIVGKSAASIAMPQVLQQLFEVTEQFGMETREELILLQRTMVSVEGVARSLDPNFDMWAAARPEVEKWIAENLGPAAALRDVGAALTTLSRIGPKLPILAERAAMWIESDEEGVQAPTEVRSKNLFWRGVAAGTIGAMLAVFVASLFFVIGFSP